MNKENKRLYQRTWKAQRRAKWIESKGGYCAKCGSTESLEVDHIDFRTKTMNPTDIWSRRKEVREKELALCQVLCNSCHTTKTHKEDLVMIAAINRSLSLVSSH